MNGWIEEEGWNTSISPSSLTNPPIAGSLYVLGRPSRGPRAPLHGQTDRYHQLPRPAPGHHMAGGCIGKEPVHFTAPALHMLQANDQRCCANFVCLQMCVCVCVCVMCIGLASVTGWPKCQWVRIELQDRVLPVCVWVWVCYMSLLWGQT